MKIPHFLHTLALLALAWPLAGRAQPFTINGLTGIDLPSHFLGYESGNLSITGVNDSGQFVGSGYYSDFSRFESDGTWFSGDTGFLYSEGAFTLLPHATPIMSMGSGIASGINNAGQVVGSYGGRHRPFLYSGGTLTDLPMLAGANGMQEGYARDVNNAGQAVGESNVGYLEHAALYSGGAVTDLGTLGGLRSRAMAINDSGQIVGSSTKSDGTASYFLYANGAMTDLGLSADLNLIDINNSGQIAGYTYQAGLDEYFGFLYQNGAVTSLGDFAPTAINDHGHIFSSYDNGVWHEGEIYDLNTLAAGFLSDGTTPGFVFLDASVISNNYIAGVGSWIDGAGAVTDRLFLLNFTASNAALTWQGDESSLFGTAGNWSGDAVPGAGNIARLATSGSSLTFNANAASLALHSKAGGTHQLDLDGHTYTLGESISDGAPALVLAGGSKLTAQEGTIKVASGVVIGESGGLSSLTLDDESTLDSTQTTTSIFLGRSGDGALTVKAGSRIFTSALVIGEKAGRSGTVEITGEGSRLEAAGLLIGAEGTGSLTLRNNAVVRAQTFEIGLQDGSSGEFRLEGAQTRFFLGQQDLGQATASVGKNGEGLLHVSAGARLIGNVTPIEVGTGKPGVSASFIVTGEGSGVEDVLVRVASGARFEILDKASADQLGLDVLAGGTALLDDAAVASPHISSAGNVTIRNGSDVIATRVDIPAGGRIEVSGAGTKLRDFQTFIVTGVLDVRDGAEVIAGSNDFGSAEINFGSQGVLTGSGGTVRANVFVSEGRVSPGQSPGILTIDGNLTLGAGSILTLEIGGTTAGTQYDRLVVTGNFSLEGGAIEFSFLGGFAPLAGQTFTFFDVGGDFTSDSPVFTVSGLEPGWDYETAFDPVSGGFSLTSLNDGIAAVPEPSTLVFAIAIVLLALSHIRRRKLHIQPSHE